MKKIQVVLADHHPSLRVVLRRLLTEDRDIEVVGEADDGVVTLALVSQLRPDVIVMDINLPGIDGQEAMRWIRASYPKMRVVVLSTDSEGSQINQFLEAGACGCVDTAEAGEQLLNAIRGAHQNQRYVSPRADAAIAAEAARDARRNEAIQEFQHWALEEFRKELVPARHRFTGRDLEVLQQLVEGTTLAQIAAALAISQDAVFTHLVKMRRQIKPRGRDDHEPPRAGAPVPRPKPPRTPPGLSGHDSAL